MRIVTSDDDSKVKASAQTKKNSKTKCITELTVTSWSLGIVKTVSQYLRVPLKKLSRTTSGTRTTV